MLSYGSLIADDLLLRNTLDMSLHGYHSIGHARAVSQFCQELALVAGLDDVVSSSLRYAGLFHDAGHSCLASVPDHRNIVGSLRVWEKFIADNSNGLVAGNNVLKFDENNSKNSESRNSHNNLLNVGGGGGEIVDDCLIRELIVCTHSGLPGEYVASNYSEAEKIIYDSDTLAGTLVLDNPVALGELIQGLRDEGYINAGDPQSFVRYRGLFSQAGLEKYSYFLE